MTARESKSERCTAVHGKHGRCGLTAGHDGPHAVIVEGGATGSRTVEWRDSVTVGFPPWRQT